MFHEVAGAIGSASGKLIGRFRKSSVEIGETSGKVIPDASDGVIYKVPGSGTPSGKPYVGSADDLSVGTRTAKDGRDRSNAEIIDTYPKVDRAARRVAEQRGINRNGGKDKLDNKRDEVKRSLWGPLGIRPPDPE